LLVQFGGGHAEEFNQPLRYRLFDVHFRTVSSSVMLPGSFPLRPLNERHAIAIECRILVLAAGEPLMLTPPAQVNRQPERGRGDEENRGQPEGEDQQTQPSRVSRQGFWI